MDKDRLQKLAGIQLNESRLGDQLKEIVDDFNPDKLDMEQAADHYRDLYSTIKEVADSLREI